MNRGRRQKELVGTLQLVGIIWLLGIVGILATHWGRDDLFRTILDSIFIMVPLAAFFLFFPVLFWWITRNSETHGPD